MTELKIDYLGDKGDGIASYEGRRIFIDRGLADEIINAKLYKTTDGIERASILSIKQPSPQRQDAPCPHYDDCGGCQMQHLKKQNYQEWIKDIVRYAFDKHNLSYPKFSDPIFIPAGTRRRVTFTVIKQGKNVTIGYNKRRSKQITHIRECLILMPELLILKEALKSHIAPLLKDGKNYDLFLQKIGNDYDCVITGIQAKQDIHFHEAVATLIHTTPITRVSWRERDRDTPHVLLEKHPLYASMGALNVPLPPLAFLQPSHDGETMLVRSVLDGLPDKAKTGADLFSGNGTFTGHLLQKGYDVFAFESDNNAVHALKKSGFQKAFQRDLFKNPLTPDELKRFDFIVLDPPRAGAKSQCEALAKSTIPHISYVSCNPSSFARDAKILCDNGYKLVSVQIVDQFPYSTHVELVSHFKKNSL